MENNTFTSALFVRKSKMHNVNYAYLFPAMAIKINAKIIFKMYIHKVKKSK